MQHSGLINAENNIIRQTTKSDPKLSAHYNRPLQLESKTFQRVMAIASGYVNNPENYIIDRICMMLISAYGLRISEVLNIQSFDISTDGTILIRSKKGSDPRLVSGLQFSKWLSKNRLFFASQMRFRNRWFYYRLFKRLGISEKMTGNVNSSVTHVFRYAFIDKMQQITGDIETTGKVIGHVSSKNTQRYEKKSKK